MARDSAKELAGLRNFHQSIVTDRMERYAANLQVLTRWINGIGVLYGEAAVTAAQAEYAEALEAIRAGAAVRVEAGSLRVTA